MWLFRLLWARKSSRTTVLFGIGLLITCLWIQHSLLGHQEKSKQLAKFEQFHEPVQIPEDSAPLQTIAYDVSSDDDEDTELDDEGTELDDEGTELDDTELTFARNEEEVDTTDTKEDTESTEFDPVPPPVRPHVDPNIKTILMWPKPMWMKRSGLRPEDMFSQCEEKRCRLTYDWDVEYNTSDCVVFYVPTGISPKDRFIQKRPGQVWVFYSGESAMNAVKLRKWQGKFNWTITMRRDSDIPRNNRQMHIHPEPKIRPELLNVVRGKKRGIAWFVSHCNTQSKRDVYTKLLQRHIRVDVYGLCGPLTCPKHHPECVTLLNDTYKFYLAFENSHCRDYITEKVFNMMTSTDIIPITRSGVNNKMYFPPNSYIDTADFQSVKDLAEFIKLLLNNERAYMRYYDSRKYYSFTWDINSKPFCDMCYRLHNPKKFFRIYDDIFDWWTDRKKDVVCPDPSDLR